MAEIMRKNHESGIRKIIVEVVMMTGCLPKHSLALLKARGYQLASLQRKVKEMEQEEILREYKGPKYRSGIERYWGYTLNWTEKVQDVLTCSVDSKLVEHFKTNSSSDGYRLASNSSEYTERLKVVKNAESLEFFYGINFRAIIHEISRTLDTDENTYYTSKIFKISGTQNLTSDVDKKKNISGTRMNGMVMSQGGNMLVYNLDKRYMGTFSITGETKAVVYGNRILAEKNKQIDGALLLAKDESLYEAILVPPSKYFQTRISGLENVYEHIYALALNETGQKMMRIMSARGWQTKLYSMILKPEMMKSKKGAVECDGYNASTDQYIFVYCVPDIKRFKKFLRIAEIDNNRDKYLVYCFDMQKDTVIKVVGQYAKVYTTKFEGVYRHICEET